MRRSLALLPCALLVTLLTVTIHDTTSEVASYGGEGALSEYLYPRPVGGWPAPFLADSPGTSIILQVGIEDQFRLGPFIASLAFWYLVLSAALNLAVRTKRQSI